MLRGEELSQLQAKITIAPRYPRFRKDGGSAVKKISILAVAIAVLSASQYQAEASLLGMPLNLKSVLDARDARAPAQACEFYYTDDVFAGPVLTRGC